MRREDLLRRTPASEEFARWAQHQTDAYDGTGGYSARFGEQGTTSTIIRPGVDSYLYQHEGELPRDYAARVYASRYDGLFRVVCDHWLGFLLAKPPTRDASMLPPKLRGWVENVDGAGTDLAEFVSSAARWGLQYGVAPTLFSATDQPVATLVYPQAVYAWALADQELFTLLKVVTVLKDVDPTTWTEIDVYDVQILGWDAADGGTYRSQLWRIYGEQEPVLLSDEVAGLPSMPLVLLRFADAEYGQLRSYTPADPLGQIARDHFNDTSRAWELRELLGTPALAVPCARGQEETIAAIKIGPRNAIPVYDGNAASFISPPQDCLQSHERALESSRLAAYRTMGLETVLAATVSSVSGVSRQYAFAHLDAALGAYAQRLARYERSLIEQAALMFGFPAAMAAGYAAEYTLEWQRSFDVEDRMMELQEAEAFLSLPGLDGVSAAAKIREVRDRFVEIDDPELLTASDAELDVSQEAPDVPENEPEPPLEDADEG